MRLRDEPFMVTLAIVHVVGFLCGLLGCHAIAWTTRAEVLVFYLLMIACGAAFGSAIFWQRRGRDAARELDLAKEKAVREFARYRVLADTAEAALLAQQRGTSS